jgi:cell division protein FtsB
MKLLRKIIFILLVLFFLFSLTKNFFNYQRNLDFYNNYKDDYEKEKKQNVTLKTQILKKSDLYEIEKVIRNKLNLSRPNEVPIIVPPTTPTPMLISPTPAPPYQQWLSLFFN